MVFTNHNEELKYKTSEITIFFLQAYRSQTTRQKQ